MALKFLGRPGKEKYVDPATNSVMERDRNCFRSGIMTFKETATIKEDILKAKLDADGKEMLDANGGTILEKVGERDMLQENITTLRPKDIGKIFSAWLNEDDVISRYPTAFQKL
jgi:hypothetical protein